MGTTAPPWMIREITHAPSVPVRREDGDDHHARGGRLTAPGAEHRNADNDRTRQRCGRGTGLAEASSAAGEDVPARQSDSNGKLGHAVKAAHLSVHRLLSLGAARTPCQCGQADQNAGELLHGLSPV